ncbi:hypothetical protein [Novosphingobium sp. 9U]|uniref:hypothetical protein n=1 Tax=Novosphingobium sp. 9U TaxID=2653158 RepID=UPI0012F177E7|nr:hypothetical protein [Novosphingobium sp. 9U]VWX52277.1 conserved exported hypothetical protein [Novosphingobium sp. 9U]
MRTILLAALAMALTGCTATAPPPTSVEQADGLARAALGQTVGVGGPKVTPLGVLEDSRCPMNARCVWAGRVRLSVRVDLGRGSQVLELTQGQPRPVADGTLELVEVQPDRVAGEKGLTIAPADYRFAFRFMGGL